MLRERLVQFRQESLPEERYSSRSFKQLVNEIVEDNPPFVRVLAYSHGLAAEATTEARQRETPPLRRESTVIGFGRRSGRSS